jgi:UDP:flavonoid glycosyltransferase YjiC (YdhE family)
MTRAHTILFWPESAAGPTNNCIGIGDRLRRQGHRVVFAAESSWAGRLDALGFEEHLVDLAEPPEGPVDAGQFWKDFIRETAPEFRRPTIEQLETVTAPIMQELIDGSRYAQDRLAAVLDDVHPDVVVEDNVVAFPALLTTGAHFVRLMSCNPLELRDPLLPPVFSGLPTTDESGWAPFRAEFARTHRSMWEEFDGWVREQGAPGLPELEFVHSSASLNLSLYPQIAAYQRSTALAPSWQGLDSSVRETDEPFELPPEVADGDGALLYLSLGSLGSADVELMQRLVDALAESGHRVIVSKGPRHEEIVLHDRMWGAETVPQTNVLPHVDLVITHGGNNTVTETLHFGKPMVVLPLFWDQYDNAQRMAEIGAGLRLETYGWDQATLLDGIERLLADHTMRQRLELDGRRIRSIDGVGVAAARIAAAAAVDPPPDPVAHT